VSRKLNYETRKRQDAARTSLTDRLTGCVRSAPTERQLAYMKRLASERGTTFATTDICCVRHASYWITGAKALTADKLETGWQPARTKGADAPWTPG
jgi:hypothetical protein